MPCIPDWSVWVFWVVLIPLCWLRWSFLLVLSRESPFWVLNEDEVFIWRICSRTLWRVVEMSIRLRILKVWWRWTWSNGFNACVSIICPGSNALCVDCLLWESASLFLCSTASLCALQNWRSARLFRCCFIEQSFLRCKGPWLSDSCRLYDWHMLSSCMSARRIEFMTRLVHFCGWLSNCRSHVLRMRHCAFLSRCCVWMCLHQFKI